MLWDSVLPDALDWTVAMRPVYRHNGQEVPGKREIYRIDNDAHISVVGADYVPLQNHECAEFLTALENSHVEKAGVFNGGSRVWWAIRLPGVLNIAGDKLHKYSIMVNAYDGMLGFRWFITPIRPHCSNMINMLIRSAMDFSISARHTKNIKMRVNEASRVFARAEAIYAELEKAYADLANQEFKGPLQQFAAAVLQPSDMEGGRFASAWDRIYENYTNDPQRGNNWGALNAVTQYLDHQRPMRGHGQEERRFSNALFGTTAALKQRAYQMIQEGPDGPNYLSYTQRGTEESIVEELSTAGMS